MNKEKEIEEMADVFGRSCHEQGKKNMCYKLDCNHCTAEFLISAGYRKADEVRKETAKDILQELYPYIGHWLTFKALKEKYGVEVDE